MDSEETNSERTNPQEISASNLPERELGLKETLYDIFHWIFVGGRDANDAACDIEDSPPVIGTRIIKILAALILVFLAWAGFAQVDEVVRGTGRIITSSRIQVIQSAEAGVIKAITVHEGQRVEQGEVLVQLDDTSNSSDLGEVVARGRVLEAQVERLRLEHEGDVDAPYTCPRDVLQSSRDICANEDRLREARRESLQSQRGVLIERVEQRQRELNEVRSRLVSTTESLSIAREEMELIAPLVERQVMAATDLLQARRVVNDLDGERRAVQQSIAGLQAELREANIQLDGQLLQFRQDALAEMTERLSELAVARETIRGASDRVRNADIRSPVGGIVNSLYINTVGGFVNPGTRVMDIVPVEDQLLVETKVTPTDIAFIHVGQPTNVKVSAYDYTIYGGLEGEVMQVSASSMLDEATRQTYYTVVVKTERSILMRNGVEHAILPGMVSDVEILTGKKSVLSYLLKPINRARNEALRER